MTHPNDRGDRVVELVEWRWTAEPVDVPRQVAETLAANRGWGIEVRPAGGGWLFRPSQMVGVVAVGEWRFSIRPKIGMRNLFALLDVDVGSLTIGHDLFDFDTEPDLLVALVRLFRHRLDDLLAKGMRRDYQGRAERLRTIRGRLDFAGLATRPGPGMWVPCRYEEYTADIALNRLLLAATDRSLRVPGVPSPDRVTLRRHLGRFEGVSLEPDTIEAVRDWNPTRLDEHYRAVVPIAKLIVGETSPVDRAGGWTGRTFLLDMNKLVEAFIGDRLRRHLHDVIEVQEQAHEKFDVDGRVDLYPDLVFRRAGRPVFVADVKYKNHGSLDSVATADLNQLHTYATILGLPAGALITCIAGEATTVPDQLTVRRSSADVHLWPVDLRGKIEDIDTGLGLLADRVRAYVRPGRDQRLRPVS